MRKKLLSLFAALLMLLSAIPFAASAAKPPTLEELQVKPGATTLDLGDIRLKDLTPLMALLEQHPGLEQVDMFASPVNKEQVAELTSRFPNIRFGWTLKLVEKHVIRTDATAFAINHNKRSVTHKSEDFELLKYCTELRALDLGHNRITDISFLKDLTELRVMILAGNHITDISTLAGLPNLEYLELFNNRIEDFSPLAKLDKLIDLNLAFNQCENIEVLSGLKGLERLWLYHSNNRHDDKPIDVTRVDALRAALPNCHIDHTHYSTTGGWRTHPRYYVVFNMLHGELAWLPWDAEGLVPRYN